MVPEARDQSLPQFSSDRPDTVDLPLVIVELPLRSVASLETCVQPLCCVFFLQYLAHRVDL